MNLKSHSSTKPESPCYTQTVEQTLEDLNSDRNFGLTASEIQNRLQYYGNNAIQEGKGRSSWEIFLDQFRDIMLLMLIAVAIISGILDVINLQSLGIPEGQIPFKDTIAILLIVIINGVLGYLQESRAEKALAALKNLASPMVQVLREGKRIEVAAEQLVPGDIVFLEAGDRICGDGHILEASNFQVRESALTGEAQPVLKSCLNPGLPEDTPLGDRINLVFTGTEVLQGRAKAVITATGMSTELGKIAQMLQSVETEPTPLQQRMEGLGKALVSGSISLVVLVIVIGVLKAGWSHLKDLVEVSLSMAVAVVPEGLPAVITVTLALGTQRMVKRQALIRKLPAVETLGSVNAICSDKTGTLTQNKMIVQQVVTLGGSWEVTGEGYEPVGEFRKSEWHSSDQQKDSSNKINFELKILLIGCVLCNDASLFQNTQEKWDILGDPTEAALLSLAGKAGFSQQSLQSQTRRVGEFTFSSERKRMSVIYPLLKQEANLPHSLKDSEYGMFTKGSPEIILERCTSYQQGVSLLPLTEVERNQILQSNELLAGEALRVLGFAYKPLSTIPQENDSETTETEMIWLGLVGMMDAPRKEVKEAVRKCRRAGIRPIMITGDHQLTASAIAERLAITQSGDKILTGKELENISQSELERKVISTSIYARVAPEHKLRIVQALQKQDGFVAMTGDGVNDAPALKQADIGIAMGITGTDVSKEASDMVLLDDNFATIVAATEEGRVVYSNIRRFIKYILGSNIGEVIVIATAPLIGLSDVPLSPLQILWMNLVTDGLPALALAVEPPEPGVMERPPVSPKESIFARGLGFYIVRIGIVFAIITITLMVWAYHAGESTGNPNVWKTMVFTTLCIAQMGHALAVRSKDRLTIQLNPFSNPYLLASVVVTIVLQLLLIYVPPLRSFFDTEILTLQQLLICLGFSSLIFVWVELEKLFMGWWRKKQVGNNTNLK
ncbi:MAG: cation-translocating P-type ATPase [Xenococcaceae cyanobacterium MO_167.B27]|nr:cation-translocating P-type ATPase [Xenococcaceae cyanobacterium MO_167.B27]